MRTQAIKGLASFDIEELSRMVIVPMLAMLIFLGLWDVGASRIQTSLGQVPGPAEVWKQFSNLIPK